MPIIERYTADLERVWNDLVNDSRNATFLHNRRYMDYHADRFDDFSLVARDDRRRILAALPANREGNTLVSHRGLTYGGWIMPHRRCDALDMLSIWDAMQTFLISEGMDRLIYKPIPHIYHSYPSEEDLYALYRTGGKLKSTLVSSVIDLHDPLPFDQGVRQRVRKADKVGVTYCESDRWSDFWAILTELLASRYDSRPVHTLDEITMLHDRFPDLIKLYTAEIDGEVIAGTVLYHVGSVLHSQYIAATPTGKELSAVHGLHQWIIDNVTGSSRWFDLGTSNEQGGLEVNEGLLRQKCSYGARAVVYNTYEIML